MKSLSRPFTDEQLDMLYGTMEDPVFFLKQHGEGFVYEWTNPVCRVIFGTELKGKMVGETMREEWSADVHKQFQSAIEGKRRHVYRDYSLLSGFNKTLETELLPLTHDGMQFILAITRNVSSQKNIEEDYLFYQSLVRNSVDPMLLISAELVILDMNPAYEATFGVNKRNWIGSSLKGIKEPQRSFFETGRLLLDRRNITASNSTFVSRMKSDGREARFSVSYSPIQEDGIVRAFHVVFHELTNQLLLEHELKQTENILESYKDALNFTALVLIWDITGKIEFANEHFEKLTGYAASELMHLNMEAIGESLMTPKEFAGMRQVLLEGNMWRSQLRGFRKDGQTFWIDTTVIPFIDMEGEVYQLLSVSFDITEQKTMETRLHHMAFHDALTNLPNRRLMVAHFEQMVQESSRTGEQIAVLYIDGDDFKSVNDLYGHEVGDEFIHQFARALERSLQKGDVAARVGGDEFLILLPHISSADSRGQIERTVLRIQETLRTGWVIDGHSFSPTCSIGCAVFSVDGADFGQLTKKADQALYEAKKKGGGIIYFHGE